MFIDKDNTVIKENDVILFEIEDKVEKTGGINRFVTDVKLCYYSLETKRYEPLNDIADSKNKVDCRIIRDNQHK